VFSLCHSTEEADPTPTNSVAYLLIFVRNDVYSTNVMRRYFIDFGHFPFALRVLAMHPQERHFPAIGFVLFLSIWQELRVVALNQWREAAGIFNSGGLVWS
jgi:hypothetical protein